MRGAKRIIDKEMLVLGKFLNKFWVIIGFTRPEAEIFQKGDWGSGGPPLLYFIKRVEHGDIEFG